jgi:hypothetical protein
VPLQLAESPLQLACRCEVEEARCGRRFVRLQLRQTYKRELEPFARLPFVCVGQKMRDEGLKKAPIELKEKKKRKF